MGGVRLEYRLHSPGTGGLVVGRRGVDQAPLDRATDPGRGKVVSEQWCKESVRLDLGKCGQRRGQVQICEMLGFRPEALKSGQLSLPTPRVWIEERRT